MLMVNCDNTSLCLEIIVILFHIFKYNKPKHGNMNQQDDWTDTICV